MKRSLLFLFVALGVTVGIITSSVQLQQKGEEPKADLVIFSYNRPLQLYALLESAEKYITSLGQTHVVYRASTTEYAQAYDEVHKIFSAVYFAKQGDNPAADFKPLTLKATFDSPNNYILFAVDDIIIKDAIDLAECIKALEQTNAYGFFLRLGKNLTECYSHRCRQPFPPLQEVEPGIFAWKFFEGRLDWAYPHTVDMTLYRKEDIKSDFQTMHYRAPNMLEGQWSTRAGKITRRVGLCYEQSKIVNLPLNVVQDVQIANRQTNSFQPIELLEIFNENKKIDIDGLHCINNKAAHMDYAPTFIGRNEK